MPYATFNGYLQGRETKTRLTASNSNRIDYTFKSRMHIVG